MEKAFVSHTETVGSFSMDPNTQFKDEVRNVTESITNTFGLDVNNNLTQVLSNSSVKEQYKEELFSSVQESISHDDEIQQHLPQKLEQLFENTAEEIMLESYEGQLLPIVGYSMPILKKSFLKSAAKDMLLTEVPQQPVVKVAFERKFLKDIDGNKYYIPEIFYDDSYKEIMQHAHGKQIPTKWYPQTATGSIQIQELDLLAEAGGSMRTRDTISPNFYIDAVVMEIGGEDVVVDGLQVRPERSINGGFSVSVRGENETTGDKVVDNLTGRLDYYNGKISVSCTGGYIKQVRFNGRLSNQNNTQTVELDMERESLTWEIPHGPHINTGLTVENLKDMKALNNIDVASQAISDMADTYNQYEDSEQIDFILQSFDRWHGKRDLPFGFKNGFTELYEFDASAHTTTFLPQSEWIHDIKYRLNREMDSLKEKLKSEELMFIIIANPAHITLFTDSIEWTFQQGSTVGNIQMEYDYGVLTKSGSRAKVVSSMKIPRSEGIHILAYATTPNNITRKHYKYSQSIRNDYRNPLSPNTPNIMAETRFLTTEVTPVHGKMEIKNDEFGRLTEVR